MIPHANLRPGPGFRPRRVALYYAQRLVVAPRLRRSIARAIASVIGRAHRTDAWAPVAPQYAGVVSTLRERGIALLPGLVSEDRAKSILDSLLRQDVLLADGRRVPATQLTPDTQIATYPLPALIGNIDVWGLINAAPVMRIAADYLGCKPTLSGLGAYWSIPGNEPALYIQQFHRDVDDWRFVKLFVYLTDVDHGSGPHAYVLKSHRTSAEFRARLYSRRAIDSRHGPDNVHTVLGPRGTAFMADTFGIHAGLVPTRTPRLVLQAQYSVLPVFAFRYEPVEAEGITDLDPYVTRLLITKKGSPPTRLQRAAS